MSAEQWTEKYRREVGQWAEIVRASGAKADTDIIINLGFGGFYGKNISCATGARIVSQRFNSVRMNECKG